MKKVKLLNGETDSMVDRRIIVKLLTTYFERGQSPEIMQLMARMLSFSEEDKRRVGLQGRRSVLKAVATAPFQVGLSVWAAPCR